MQKGPRPGIDVQMEKMCILFGQKLLMAEFIGGGGLGWFGTAIEVDLLIKTVHPEGILVFCAS